MMPQIRFNGTPAVGKYAVVTVKNPDGTLNRRYRITAAQHAAFRAQGSGPPPGCTVEEWTSGRAVCAGHSFEVGDARRFEDGTLVIKYAEDTSNNDVRQSVLILGPDDYTGIFPDITITAAALIECNLAKGQNESGANRIGLRHTISIVQNGLLTYGD